MNPAELKAVVEYMESERGVERDVRQYAEFDSIQ